MKTASHNRWSEALSSPSSAVELESVAAFVNRLREHEKVRTLEGEAK